MILYILFNNLKINIGRKNNIVKPTLRKLIIYIVNNINIIK